MTRALLLAATLFAALVVLSPAPATAEEDEDTQCHLVNGVYECPDMVLEVELRRPNVFYVVDRSRLRVHLDHADESFTGDVVDSVNQNPF